MKPLVEVKNYMCRTKPFSRFHFSEDAMSFINSDKIIVEKFEDEVIIRTPSFYEDNFRLIRTTRSVDVFFNDETAISGDFILVKDGDEFILTPTSEKIEKIKGCPKKVINTETNEIYNSVKELAQIVKIHHDTLYKVLNGKQKNKTPYRYVQS